MAAIDSTGQLYTWAYNNNGQLGQGDSSSTRSSPTAVSGFTNVSDVVVRGNTGFIMVLKTDGTVWFAGDNTNGEFGNGGSLATNNTFTQVTSLIGTTITKIFGNDIGGVASG